MVALKTLNLAKVCGGGDVLGFSHHHLHPPSLRFSLSQSTQRPWWQWTTMNDGIDAIGGLS